VAAVVEVLAAVAARAAVPQWLLLQRRQQLMPLRALARLHGQAVCLAWVQV
jgi:hypothetical protein